MRSNITINDLLLLWLPYLAGLFLLVAPTHLPVFKHPHIDIIGTQYHLVEPVEAVSERPHELLAEKVIKPIPGSKEDWMTQAGIPESDWMYVDYIISHESGWNPTASNPSGASGLPQALPYSKTGCVWGDPICQLKWASGYARERYGSWAGAYSHWLSNHVW